MSELTLEDAKQAKREAEARLRQRGDYYGVTHTNSLPTTEPADPPRVDHGERRQVRLAHESFDATNLPAPVVECGCGDCPDYVDPLADEPEGPFADLKDRSEMAQDVCPSPRPMTLERAREAYLRYQRASYNHPRRYSKVEEIRAKHGLILGAGRELQEVYGDSLTTVLLSLRISPIEVEDGTRRWVEPVKLDQWLHSSWDNIKRTMRYHLDGFDWEYLAITTTTTSAATPHTHVLVYVDDPDDEVSIEMVRSMVQSHVNNAQNAYESDHRVRDGRDDAGNIRHDPPTVDVTDDRHLPVLKSRDGEGFHPTTAGLNYIANQRPHWVLDNVYDGDSDVNTDSVLVDGGAIAWAAQHRWLKPSQGLDLQNGGVSLD